MMRVNGEPTPSGRVGSALKFVSIVPGSKTVVVVVPSEAVVVTVVSVR